MRNSITVASIALVAAIALPSVAKAEILNTPFYNSSGIDYGTPTVDEYYGTVSVTVSGVGWSKGTQLNDAFFLLNNGSSNINNPLDQPFQSVPIPANQTDPFFYGLGFSTTPGALDSAANNDGKDNEVGRILFNESLFPTYSPTNTYTFNLNTGFTSSDPGLLYFGIVDNQTNDNGGSFTINVTGNSGTGGGTVGTNSVNTPEPGALALFAGLSLSGIGFIRRRKALKA